MELLGAVRAYVERMLGEVPGMKALVLDRETMEMVSMVLTQSQILEREVFLVRRIDAPMSNKEELNHLRAIFFLRPTAENVRLLGGQLRNPQFSEVYLYFSNTIKNEMLKQIATADQFELVRQVQEFYGDYKAINSDLFSLGIPSVRFQWTDPTSAQTQRIAGGLLALMLSTQSRPHIRYQGSSNICKSVAVEVSRLVAAQTELFPERATRSTLLVLDRREDPVTPLLHQWTYQAMLHDVFGLVNNKVDLTAYQRERGEKNKMDKRVLVLGCEHDDFYKETMYLNYGDLGSAVKELVEEYQRKTKSGRKIDTIADMQRFVENYSEYLTESGTVSKHVALMTELSHQVDTRNLMKISALEQSLACENDHAKAVDSIEVMLRDSSVQFEEKLRVVLLYALRYENHRNEIPAFRVTLQNQARTQRDHDAVLLIDGLLRFAGHAVRSGDLYSNKDILSKATNFLSSGLKGVENIYTQHEPVLTKILNKLTRGRLKEHEFPFVDAPAKKSTPSEVIVFIVGGATYEEAAVVAQLNAASSETRIVLGGTTVHNASSFLEEVAQNRY